MPPPPPPSPGSDVERPDPAIARTVDVLDLAFGPPSQRNYDIRLWDGTLQRGGLTPAADFSMVFQRRGALRRMLIRPSELSIVEALISGDVEIEGNMESAMGLSDTIGRNVQSGGGLAKLIPRVVVLPKDDEAPRIEESRYRRGLRLITTRKRKAAESEIRFHYDVGNEFYALWLDPRMLYSCGYYKKATDDLATAQLNKLDHICRKLRLQPGDRYLDIGCGWGGLVMHAVENYGVLGRGITLSAAQAEWAQKRIAEKGIGDRCTVEVMDFRDLPADARFEKMSSVGVTEHIPEDQQVDHFRRVFAALEPGGLFMNHCEVSTRTARRTHSAGEKFSRWLWKRDQFIDKYVFPDGKLVPLASIIRAAEKVGFETRDVESLREHYAMTLRAWVRGLEHRKSEAVRLVGERTYLVWKLYMSAGAYGFRTAGINLAQTLLAKPRPDGSSNMPLTREYMYQTPV
ncbi:MAG TPA: class I SAM-dependent methyltransferase [Gemmatimonadaceae bacterium]|nr:class I SAM-dependent methyltransferase [Gemmatimonadaceae bacterium]